MSKLPPHSRTGCKMIRAFAFPVALLSGLAQMPIQAQTLSSLAVTAASPAVEIGGTTQLVVTAKDSTGSLSNVSDKVTWSSSDPSIIEISSSGLASGHATGTVSVTASYQGTTSTTSLSSSTSSISWSGPITITSGGTYSGSWRSTNPKTPAVTIATTAPVTIENSYVTGPNDLISDPVYGNHLTVKNVTGIGVNPNVSGQSYGIFVDAQNPVSLDVENCYFETVRFGVWVRGYAGNRNGTETITILNNRGRNVTGTESNGSGGTLPGEKHWNWAHAIQLTNVHAVPGIRMAWNEIINYPGQSMVNEQVNIFDSGGTANSPAEFHDNYIQGAYPYNPAVDSYNGGGYTTDGGSSDTKATASAYNRVYNNQIVGTVNMAIEFDAGHDNTAYDNRVISSGLLPNGTKIPSQNVGLSIYDAYGNTARGTMYNNNVESNTVGWMCWASRCNWDGHRNDQYYEVNTGDYKLNTSIAANPITLQMEATEYSNWLAKVRSNGMLIGPNASLQK